MLSKPLLIISSAASVIFTEMTKHWRHIFWGVVLEVISVKFVFTDMKWETTTLHFEQLHKLISGQTG